MNKLPRILWYSLFLPALLLAAGCSDDEPSPPSEASAPSAAHEAAQETAGVEFVATGSGFDPVSEYDRQCPVENDDQSLECDWLHALVAAEVTEALDEIELSRDQRGTAEALKALDLAGEPEILIAAMRILGQFPDTPGITEKALPLMLDSPYLKVAEMAARLLSEVPDPTVSGIGSQWSGHDVLPYTEDPYAELPAFPEHYWDMGFPEYPGAEWFAPADSDRSVGWISEDPLEVVVGKLSEMLGAEVLTYEAWIARSQEITTPMFQPPDNSQMEEMQKLMEEYMQTQDPKLMERFEAMSKAMQESSDKTQERYDKMLLNAAQPPYYVLQEQWSVLIAEERDGRISRLITVYPVPALGQTAIQMFWDLNDFPPAWELEQ